jgi:hypothetical protein
VISILLDQPLERHQCSDWRQFSLNIVQANYPEGPGWNLRDAEFDDEDESDKEDEGFVLVDEAEKVDEVQTPQWPGDFKVSIYCLFMLWEDLTLDRCKLET